MDKPASRIEKYCGDYFMFTGRERFQLPRIKSIKEGEGVTEVVFYGELLAEPEVWASWADGVVCYGSYFPCVDRERDDG